MQRILTLTRPASVAAPAATDRAAVGDQQEKLGAAAREAGIALTVDRRYSRLLNALSVTVPADQAHRLPGLSGDSSVSTPATYQPPDRPSPVPASVLAKAITGGARSPARSDDSAFGGGNFPNARITGGHDFADADADTYDDSSGPAFGHGTHMAGIIAGDDTHIQGVAPDAKLRSYRVFGEERPADESLLIAALERAVGDGADVINMCGGGRSERHRRPGQRLRRPVQHRAPGHRPAGDSRRQHVQQPLPVPGREVERRPGNTSAVRGLRPHPLLPTTGSYPVVVGAASYAPLPEGSLTGKAVLFKAVSTAGCRPMDLLRVYEKAGAAAGLYYQDFGDPDTIAGQPCCGTAGIPAVSLSFGSARRVLAVKNPTVTGGAYAGLDLDDDHAGLMDDGSSWGPGNELEFKPDVAAPGGYVLSALPPSSGSYGVMSGSSMAAPHVAGVAALLLQRDRRLSPARVRSVLQNTASPLGLTGNPARGPEPVAHQSAGRINAMAALRAVDGAQPYATTAELALGDLEGGAAAAKVTVRNPGRAAVTYAVSHRSAVSAAPPYTHDWEARDASATVMGLPDTVTVPARSTRTIRLRVKQPHGVPDGTLLGGWITLTPASDGAS